MKIEETEGRTNKKYAVNKTKQKNKTKTKVEMEARSGKKESN